MSRIFLFLAALAGFLAVALGAFGAHALGARLSTSAAAAFQTGVHYQFTHALALGLTAALLDRWGVDAAALAAAGWCFAAGTLAFSGSLYVLALTGRGTFGVVTPVGGLALMAGWALLAWSALSRRG